MIDYKILNEEGDDMTDASEETTEEGMEEGMEAAPEMEESAPEGDDAPAM